MYALEIRELKKTYRNGRVALQGIDLAIEEGDFFALLGPNGAGKSTTIGIVSSLITKQCGTVCIFGHDLDRERETAKSFLGLVPQEINFSQFEKVKDIVVNQAGFYGVPRKTAEERAETVLRRLDLWDRRNDVSRTLSGGLKRRLMIARALAHEPKLLILDEPTAGVDIELRRSMWEFLRRINAEGTTIVLTTHYLEEAESLCRNIAIIDHGRIIEDTSMKTLLAKLHRETFILDLRAPLGEMPHLNGFEARRIDATTLEVDVFKHQNINTLFSHLSSAGTEVVSLRNKANRLEELFIGMLNNGKSGTPGS